MEKHTIKPLMNFISKAKPLGLIVLILTISHSTTIFQNKGLMIFDTDSYSQMLQFYLGGWQKLRNLDFSFWSWSSGYGANYFNHVYYFATSPFFLFTLFFDKAVLPYLSMYLNALKLAFLFFASYRWLNAFTQHWYVVSIGALIITFSGWVTFLYHYSMFLDGFILYPLILWSIDCYLSSGKRYFPWFLGLLGIVNYYLLYMFIPFIVLYTLMRFVSTYETKKQSMSGMLVNMFLMGLGGLGLSAVILFPSIAIVLNTPRLQVSGSFFETISFLQLYRYFSTIYSPTIAWNNPTYFIPLHVDLGLGWGGGVSVYSFYLAPILIPFLFTLKDRLMKRSILGMYSVLGFLATFLGFYRLFQGTVDVRWYYMFLFLNVYALIQILNALHTQEINKHALLGSWFLNTLILFALYQYSSSQFPLSMDELDLLKKVVVYGGLLLAIYTVLLYFLKWKLLLILVSVEASFSFMIPLQLNPPMNFQTFQERYQNELEPLKAIEWIQAEDPSFYRIIRDDIGGNNLNEPFANQYPGITFYESIYNFEMTDFIQHFTNKWLLPLVYGRTNTNILASIKYYIQTNDSIEVPFGFVFFKHIDNADIFINRYWIGLGFTVENSLNEEVFKDLSLYQQDQLWLNTIIIKDSPNRTLPILNRSQSLAVNDDDGYLYLDSSIIKPNSLITIENKGVPYLTLNRYTQDSMTTEYHYQYDYYQTFVSDSLTALEIVATNPYGSSSGINVYMENPVYYTQWYESRSFIQNISIQNDKLSGDIQVTKDQPWLVTSIPYDPGWSVLVDGKEEPFTKVNLGFIGLYLSEGLHHLEFNYEVPYLKSGFLISLISLVSMMWTSFYKPIRKRFSEKS